MVKPQKFVVALYDKKDVYVPGDEVTGQLEIHLEEDMEMKEVIIKFVGKAYVFFSEGKDNYSATEKFFSEKVVVYGQDSTTEKVSLTAGFHKYPFHFRLPNPLASSYQDHFGYIKYSVKGRIVKPRQIDNRTSKVITVLDSLDLNHRTDNMLAQSSNSDSKTLCCWCCAGGTIEGDVKIDRSGYVPGEWIVANATLENNSSSLVRQTSLEFVKIVTYHAPLRSKTVIKALTKQMGPPCNQGNTVILTDVKLQIPPVPPSEFNHCKIIDIKYAVMLMAHLRTFAINLRVCAPLVVGTVPLASLPQYKDRAIGNEIRNEGVSTPQISSTTLSVQGPPPPTYAFAMSESFQSPKKQNEDDDDTSYKPKYTYYDWGQSAFSYQ